MSFEVGAITAKMQLDMGEWRKSLAQVGKDTENLNKRFDSVASGVTKLQTQFDQVSRILEGPTRQWGVMMERMSNHAAVAAKDIRNVTAASREMGAVLPKSALANKRALEGIQNAGRQAGQGIGEAANQAGILGGILGRNGMSLGGFAARMAGAYGASVLLFRGVQNLTGILPDAIRLSIAWEDAFAGVRKTVDGSEADLDRLARSIRKLSLELPISAREIARIAELGGQLGVSTENLDKFARTISGLVISTDLSAEDAATSLAQFIEITGTAEGKIENIASVLVRLGNTSATSEGKILDLALRIAGAGNLIGLTEPQILGMAAAVSSLGIRAEAGGTALQEMMIAIARETKLGSEQLGVFAALADRTSEGFQKLLDSNPQEAILRVVEGIAEFDKVGGNAYKLMEDLGFGGAEMTRAVLGLANAQDLMRRKTDEATDEMDANRAATEEVEKRLETTQSKLTTTGNKWIELKTRIGEVNLPEVNTALDGTNSFLDTMTENVGLLEDAFRALLAPLSDSVRLFNWISGATGLGGISAKLDEMNVGSARNASGAALSEFEAYRQLQQAEAQRNLISVLNSSAAPVVHYDQVGAMADRWLDEIASGGSNKRTTVESALGNLDKGGSGGKKTSELDRLKREGEALHRSLFPVIDALKTAEEQTKALGAAGLLTGESLGRLGESLYSKFSGLTEEELGKASASLQGFNVEVASAFDTAMGKARQEEATKFWESIQPPEATAFSRFEEGLKNIRNLAEFNPEDMTIFARWVYEDILGQVAPDKVQKLIDKIREAGDVGKTTATEILRLQESDAHQSSANQGESIWRGLNTGKVMLEDLRQSMMNLMDSGRLMSDPEAAGAFTAETWERLGEKGQAALKSIIEELTTQYPQYAATIEQMTIDMERFKKAADFEKFLLGVDDAANRIGQLSNQIKDLSSNGIGEVLDIVSTVAVQSLNVVRGVQQAAAAFRILATTAEVTGRIIAIAMAEATAGVTLIIMAIIEAAKALDIFGTEGEKELKGIDKLFDQLGDKVEEWGEQFTDVLVDFVKTGEATFKEFVDSVLEDILRLTIQTTITDPIVGAIQGMFAQGAAFDRGNVVPFAKGGVVSKPTIFPMADGMGLMGEAGPEAVMPLKRMPGGALGVQAQGAGGVKVEVYDQRSGGAPVEVQEHQGPNGERVVKMIVRDAVNEMLADGTFDRRLSSNYGIRRRPV